MKHYIKIFPQHYERVAKGTKTFEIRENDRFYQKGDEVKLYAFYEDGNGYCSEKEFPPLLYQIGDVYPIDSNRVVFSLLKI